MQLKQAAIITEACSCVQQLKKLWCVVKLDFSMFEIFSFGLMGDAYEHLGGYAECLREQFFSTCR